MPPFTIGAFRVNFPEFADTVKYSDQLISYWAAVAQAMVLPTIWKPQNMYLLGVNLYIAHELVIASQNQNLATTGGVPGTSSGIANSKTVGAASISFDAASSTEKDAGYWNQSTYGKQFIRLARIFGARPIQL